MQLRRQVLEQEGHGAVDGKLLDEVIIVEDQDNMLWQGTHVVDEFHQDCVDGRRLGRLEVQRCGAEAGMQCVQRSEDVAPELCRIILAAVQGDPGERALPLSRRFWDCAAPWLP